MMSDLDLDSTLQDMRREFDDAFAQPHRSSESIGERILAIRVRNDPYALKLAEIDGLFCDRVVVSTPSPLAALLGVVGFRGQIVPAYDLGYLMGYGRTADTLRWLVLLRQKEPVALAFESFEAQQHLPSRTIAESAHASPQHRTRHLVDIVETDLRRPMISLASVFSEIRQSVAAVNTDVGHPSPLRHA